MFVPQCFLVVLAVAGIVAAAVAAAVAAVAEALPPVGALGGVSWL